MSSGAMSTNTNGRRLYTQPIPEQKYTTRSVRLQMIRARLLSCILYCKPVCVKRTRAMLVLKATHDVLNVAGHSPHGLEVHRMGSSGRGHSYLRAYVAVVQSAEMHP